MQALSMLSLGRAAIQRTVGHHADVRRMRRSRGKGRAASLCFGLPAARAGVWRRRGAACKAWRCGEARFRAVGRSRYHPAFLAGYAASQSEKTRLKVCSTLKTNYESVTEKLSSAPP